MKSYVTTVVRYTWYAFESRSFIIGILIVIQYSYLHALIGILHIIHGLILDRVTFDTLA